MRKTIPIQTIYGIAKIKVTVRKWLAINRQQDDFWVVTHIPTGLRLPGYFFSKKQAIAASKLARRIFPYPVRRETAPTQEQWFSVLESSSIGFIR